MSERLFDPPEWESLSDEQRNTIHEWHLKTKGSHHGTLVSCITVTFVETIILMKKLFESQYIGLFAFQYITNQRTGELSSLLESVFLYFLLWGLASLWWSCYMMLLAGIIAAIFTKVFERTHKIKGIGDGSCVYFAAILAGVFIAFFVILNAFGVIITPNPFPV